MRERQREQDSVAEGKGLEPLSPKAPVFKTGALPITLTLREDDGDAGVVENWIVPCRAGGFPYACPVWSETL